MLTGIKAKPIMSARVALEPPRGGEMSSSPSEWRDELVPQPRECYWQICPSELPDGLPEMALELWNGGDNQLHLLQFLLLRDKSGEVPWYDRIAACLHFIEAPGNR